MRALSDLVHMNAHAKRDWAKARKVPLVLDAVQIRDIYLNPCTCNIGLAPFPVVSRKKLPGYELIMDTNIDERLFVQHQERVRRSVDKRGLLVMINTLRPGWAVGVLDGYLTVWRKKAPAR